jgi:GT2 family glycosyltransferase
MNKENKFEKICIGIPHTGTFPWQTVMGILALEVPRGFKIVYHLIGSCLVYDARDKIANFAIDNDCKYTLMLDSDMVPPKDMLLKMTALLETKKEIGLVTGMATKRTPPFQPCVYTKLEYDMKTQKPRLESPIEFPDEGLMAVAGVGMACCMIRTDIFREVKKQEVAKMGLFYPLPNLGEDLSFCLVARKLGLKMIADLSLHVGHVASMPVGIAEYRACYDAWKEKNNNKPLFTEGCDS